MTLTNAQRATRWHRVSTVAAVFAWLGLLLLATRLVGDLVGLNPAEVCGHLGVLVGLPAWIVWLLAEQLADRYRDGSPPTRPLFRMSEETRLARFRYRVRRRELASISKRDRYESDAFLAANSRVIEAERALPWWLRLDIDLTT